jgi:hypothetical protein
MHETNHENVKGYIDFFDKNEDSIFLKGWSFHILNNICNLRVKYIIDDNYDCPRFIHNNINNVSNMREDVIKSYNFESFEKLYCGWEFNLIDKNITSIDLEMFFDEKWNIIFTFEKYIKNLKKFKINKLSGYIPSFVVVDNFYQNVDSIRELALSQTFEYHINYHKGKRTEDVFRFEGLKESFESILNCKIINWDKYGVNACFQYCIGGDQLVYHYDGQEYAGIIFLTPNPPPQSGTSFYRSIHTKNMKCQDDDSIVFKNGYLDPTEFEAVDVVGNKYNRLVLFDAKMFHAASGYFGTNINNGRLFQLFFFDLER